MLQAADISDQLAVALVRKPILHLVPSLDDTAQTQELLSLTQLLIEAGARVVLASEPGRMVPEFQAHGANWIDLPASTRNPVSMYANARKLSQIIKDEQIALVHAHSRAPAWSAVTALKGSKVKLVTTWHDVAGKGSASRDLYDSVAAKGDRVITRSRLAMQALIERFPDAEARLRLLPAPVEQAGFADGAVQPERVAGLRRDWGIGPDARLILGFAPSGLTDEADIILKAMTRVASEAMHLVLVTGDTESVGAQAISQQAEKLGIGQAFHCAAGWSDPAAAITAAAGVIAPAASAGGGLALRSQLLGRPVIARNDSAASDIIAVPPDVAEQARTGWLHDGQIDSLKAALAALCQHRPSQRVVLESHAIVQARKRNNPWRPLIALAEVYAELLTDV
jgi:hypothetical protein